MNRDEIEALAQKLNLKRYKMFISLCSADLTAVRTIISSVDTLDLCYWSMYYESGTERNRGGDNYSKMITEQLSRACLLVPILSQNSLTSDEVYKELKDFADNISIDNKRLQIFPIALDRSITYANLPEKIRSLHLIENETLIRYFSAETAPALLKELTRKYISALLENIDYSHSMMVNARKFVDLMNYCISKDCISRSVSDDIKSCDEVRTTTLREVHILTNELNNYDANTYSCMVISSNLAARSSDIHSDGVKYYYYCPANYAKENWDVFRNKIRSFVKKDNLARQEVANMIRREFCQRNKVLDFFQSFGFIKRDELLEKYHVVVDSGVREMCNLLSSDKNMFTISYDSDYDEIYSVPENFKKWLTADYGGDTPEEVIKDDAYKFIAFMEEFVRIVSSTPNVNSVLSDELDAYCKDCGILRDMERWQLREIKPETLRTRILTNYPLSAKHGGDRMDCPYKKLADWMQFTYDAAGNEIPVSDEDVSTAMANLHCFALDRDTQIDPCFSFVFFINENSASASWYSTGVSVASDANDMVIVYDAQKSEYTMFADAFAYLAELNPSIKSELTRSRSVLLTRYRR